MLRRRKDSDWEQRLDKEVNRISSSPSYQELTLNRIRDLVSAPNDSSLLLALSERIANGSLRVVYRVVSPRSNASIGEYQSLREIPESLLDDSTGQEIDIDRFRDVEVVYLPEVHRD